MSVSFMARRDPAELAELCEPLNVSNANAAKLLELLGLREDAEPVGEFLGGLPLYGELAGECPGADFLGRVLTATALLDTVTEDYTPPVTDTLRGGATVVHCGRRPGYLADRLAALETIARAAADGGGTVVWA